MLAIEHEVHGYQLKIFRGRAVADKFIHFVSEVVGAVAPSRDDLRHAADRLVLTELTPSRSERGEACAADGDRSPATNGPPSWCERADNHLAVINVEELHLIASRRERALVHFAIDAHAH